MQAATQATTAWPMPALAGIGLRSPHFSEFLDQTPQVGWVEVHSENFFTASRHELNSLEQVRKNYELSLHGVGLSIGSVDVLNAHHIRKLRQLVQRYEPCFVSEHLCWSSVDGNHFNDLLPLPYTEESLQHVIDRVDRIQSDLGQRLLLENVSSYLTVSFSVIPESEFLNAVAERTGCGILLDVNNLYVNASNHGFDPVDYLQGLSTEAILEYHLGGFTEVVVDGQRLLIDSHDHDVAEDVWDLYRTTVCALGPKPTLIEWDAELPPLQTLVAIADRAELTLDSISESS